MARLIAALILIMMIGSASANVHLPQHACNGTVFITPNTSLKAHALILTAAHCIEGNYSPPSKFVGYLDGDEFVVSGRIFKYHNGMKYFGTIPSAGECCSLTEQVNK